MAPELSPFHAAHWDPPKACLTRVRDVTWLSHVLRRQELILREILAHSLKKSVDSDVWVRASQPCITEKSTAAFSQCCDKIPENGNLKKEIPSLFSPILTLESEQRSSCMLFNQALPLSYVPRRKGWLGPFLKGTVLCRGKSNSKGKPLVIGSF